MKIKFCGIKSSNGVNFIKKNSVDYVGINFVLTSKRKISEDFLVRNISILSEKTKLIALFMNENYLEIERILKKFPEIYAIQLHGSENLDLIKKIQKNFPKIKVWKAFSEKLEKSSGIFLEDYLDQIDLALFDGSIPGSGQMISATGWLAKNLGIIRKNQKLFGIAGGINMDNIQKFQKNFPDAYLLDTASGVEKDSVFSPKKALNLLEKNGFFQR